MADVPGNLGRRAQPGASGDASEPPGISGYPMHKKASGVVAGGVINVEFGYVPQSSSWNIERALCKCKSTTPTEFTLYMDEVSDDAELTFTPAGVHDDAGFEQPIWVPGSVHLIGQFTGVSAVDALGNPTVAFVRLQLRAFD